MLAFALGRLLSFIHHRCFHHHDIAASERSGTKRHAPRGVPSRLLLVCATFRGSSPILSALQGRLQHGVAALSYMVSFISPDLAGVSRTTETPKSLHPCLLEEMSTRAIQGAITVRAGTGTRARRPALLGRNRASTRVAGLGRESRVVFAGPV